MIRAWTRSGPWQPLTGEQLASLANARAKFAETRTWAYNIGNVSPECLAQQRAYDRERHKSQYEENKESIAQYSKDGVRKRKNHRLRSKRVSCAVVATQREREHNIAQPRNIIVQCRINAPNT